MAPRLGADAAVHDGAMRTVPIRDDAIRLGQFLKLADLVDTGADAKTLVADGKVSVNDEVETRRGRRLVAGDVVATATERVTVG
jgi:ribosome-associated protein